MQMSLLTLKNIGKIYVSEGNVTVGIRGVNLSFDRGEFVAVTGKSGSGKSTLLSVISGMDTYEEGDLLIEGKSTAHYTQPDWEEYRQKYISFIFQDYNIIESFTVLQNVELALMHITDHRERRRRALELIRRVGLSGHLRQKGSKLSGGQKQRTVIARALAKDSPIILADEPTGNLDSATGKEIIELLREVSRDKLVIVVTHNFEQVEYCATRHIRIFDGAVESDHVISAPDRTERPVAEPQESRIKAWHGGRVLGHAMFTSRPKLTTFMCLLLIVGMLGLFFATSTFDDMNDLFEPNRMFRYLPGRVVLTHRDGAVISDAELAEIAAKYGAKNRLHYDRLLDEGIATVWDEQNYQSARVYYSYGEKVEGKSYGRYPEARDEVFLYLPISMKPTFGTDPLLRKTVDLGIPSLRVVGVAYYYDNTQHGKAILSEEGYRTMLAETTLLRKAQLTVTVMVNDGKQDIAADSFPSVRIDNTLEDGKFILSYSTGEKTVTGVRLSVKSYNTYEYSEIDSTGGGAGADVCAWDLDMKDRVPGSSGSYYESQELILSASLAERLATDYLSKTYRQASLFFETDRQARAAAKQMNTDGYIAVTSDTTYSPDPSETILSTVLAIFTLFEWLLVVLFIAFFVNLCSSRTIGTFRGELAVMRSMGIPVRVIRVAMYVRMLLSLIPAGICLACCAVMIYTVPAANAIFPYLHWWQYLMLCVGMLLVTVRVTHKQIRRLFSQSVKKALKGGDAE